MKKLEKKELEKIKGGALSGVVLNSIIKGASLILELGRIIGSTYRRNKENKICSI